MLINIIFSVWIYEVDGGKHAHSLFILRIKFWKKWESQSKGKLVLWYYDSTEKKKKAFIGKSFDKRGQQKPRALAVIYYNYLFSELSSK